MIPINAYLNHQIQSKIMKTYVFNNNSSSIISHHIARFATIIELSEQRILDWCFVQILPMSVTL